MKESLRQQDYHKVFQKRGDCIRLLAQTSGVVIFFAWFFYRSIWAVPLLFPLGILYFRRCVNRQCRKNRQELTMQFKECILSVANSLRSGYALENAFLESREDIRMLYGEHSAMYRELELIRRGMILNITLEELISDLADRSGIEEIEQFSAILNIAKRGGGNVTQIIRTTAEVISNKVETMQEMLTMLQGRRLEQNVMEIMPFGISLYIAAAYPGYFGTLYHNGMGIIVMTLCLAVYAVRRNPGKQAGNRTRRHHNVRRRDFGAVRKPDLPGTGLSARKEVRGFREEFDPVFLKEPENAVVRLPDHFGAARLNHIEIKGRRSDIDTEFAECLTRGLVGERGRKHRLGLRWSASALR